MAAGSDFSAFSLPSHAEVVEQAVVETLQNDTELAAFTSDRIYWIPDPFAVPARRLPMIVVTSPTLDLTHVPSGEVEAELRVGISIAYDEGRGALDPNCRTIKACQARIDIALATNSRLERTAIGGQVYSDQRALVDRYGGLFTVQFSQQRFEAANAFTVLELLAIYTYTTTELTGEVVS